MDDQEVALLRFVASHGLVLAAQIRAFLGWDEATERRATGGLVERGLLRRVRLLPPTELFAVTPAACAVAGMPALSPEGVVERGVRRAVGAVWLWIRARDGRLPDARVLSAREQLAHDLTAPGDGHSASGSTGRYGIRVGGLPAGTETGLHYPDVLLVFPDGRAAAHLQLTAPLGSGLLARLRAYGADERFAQVVFLVEREDVAQQIEAAALTAGVDGMTLVRWMDWSPSPAPGPGPGPGPARTLGQR